jgi:hypothetical protein
MSACHSASLPAGRQVLKPESSLFNTFWMSDQACLSEDRSGMTENAYLWTNTI